MIFFLTTGVDNSLRYPFDFMVDCYNSLHRYLQVNNIAVNSHGIFFGKFVSFYSSKLYMQLLRATILVSLIMLIAVLGITNPGFRQPYKFLDNVEGKVEHNYYIFSVYQQYSGYTLSSDGKYKIYKRYIGIALHFYEISPVWVEKG